jgi:hypothetical protein
LKRYCGHSLRASVWVWRETRRHPVLTFCRTPNRQCNPVQPHGQHHASFGVCKYSSQPTSPRLAPTQADKHVPMLHDRILAYDLPTIALLLSSAKSEEMRCSGRYQRALEDERSRAIWDRDRFIELYRSFTKQVGLQDQFASVEWRGFLRSLPDDFLMRVLSYTDGCLPDN